MAAGHAAFGEPSGSWCARQLTALHEGEPTTVLVELAGLADTLAAGTPARERVTQSLAYLAKRFDHIQYASFLDHGYPIGSGIVESANKLVVEARLKGAGMHWSPASVNPLLALRGVACSGRWDDTWLRIATHQRHVAYLRRSCHHHQRLAPASPPSRRQPRFADGRPTSDHPWNRYPAVRPRRAKL